MKRTHDNNALNNTNSKRSKMTGQSPTAYKAELIHAVASNDVELIEKIVSDNDIDARTLCEITDELGRKLLTITIINQSGKVLEYLIEKFNKIDIVPELDQLIIDTCIKGNVNLAKLLLDIKAQVTKDSGLNAIPPTTNQDIKETIPAVNLSVNTERSKIPFDPSIYAFLQIAAENGHDAFAETLFKYTYLKMQTDNNFLKISRVYFNSNKFFKLTPGNEDKQNKMTPLHIASTWGFTDIVESILKYNVNLDISDSTGRTPLHLSIREGHSDITEALLGKGADIEKKDDNYGTPLYLAIKFSNLEALKMLVKYGVDIDNPIYAGNYDLPAIEYAVKYHNFEAAKLLLSNGCSLDGYNESAESLDHEKGSDMLYSLIISRAVDLIFELQLVSEDRFGNSFDFKDLDFALARFEHLMLRGGFIDGGELSQDAYDSYKSKLKNTGCDQVFGGIFLDEIGKIIDQHHSKCNMIMSSFYDALTQEKQLGFMKDIDHVTMFKALVRTEYKIGCGFSKLDYMVSKYPDVEKLLKELSNIILPLKLKTVVRLTEVYRDDSVKANLQAKMASYEAKLIEDEQAIIFDSSSPVPEQDSSEIDYNAILNGEVSLNLDADW